MVICSDWKLVGIPWPLVAERLAASIMESFWPNMFSLVPSCLGVEREVAEFPQSKNPFLVWLYNSVTQHKAY
jgi:hypothetical protein